MRQYMNHERFKWRKEDIVVLNRINKSYNRTIFKGGPGSGAHGHKGIPGHQGGGLPVGNTAAEVVTDTVPLEDKSSWYEDPQEIADSLKKGYNIEGFYWKSREIMDRGYKRTIKEPVIKLSDGRKYSLDMHTLTSYSKTGRLRIPSKTRHTVSVTLHPLQEDSRGNYYPISILNKTFVGEQKYTEYSDYVDKWKKKLSESTGLDIEANYG